MIFIFAVIVMIAATLGAMAGIGGGVIIRPALDAFNYFDNVIISNMISALCVLAVAFTSVVKNIINKRKINPKNSIILGIGAIVGGIVGGSLFGYIKDNNSKSMVTIIQSICLIVLLVLVIIYMSFFKEKLKFQMKNVFMVMFSGLLLGFISSFLGIGGGPINVAVLCLLFGMTVKDGAINSLIIIIFSQLSKIVQSLLNNELQTCGMPWWPMVVALVITAVVGSLLGTYLNKKLSEKTLSIFYIITMFIIIGINLYNVVYYTIN